MKFNLNPKSLNNIINLPVECLLNNYLDKQFRDAYKFLHFIDKVFLCPKFDITNSFITPSSRISIVFTIIGALAQISTHVYRFFFLSYVFKYSTKGIVIEIALFINELMYIIASILHYGNTIIQSKNSVLLMVKLQETFRILDLDSATTLNYHGKWNRINTVVISTVYFMYTGVYMSANIARGAALSSIFMVLPQMIFDMNVIYFTRTTDLIGRMLTSWNHKMLTKEAEETDSGELSNSKLTKSFYFSFANLIAAFRLCRNVFQVSIFFHVFQSFALILVTLQIIIESGTLKLHIGNLTSVAWNAKNIVLLITMSMACKKFYVIVRNIEATCTQLVNTSHDDGTRKLCKNVVRYSRAAPSKLSACGLFAVDAALPLRLLAAVLTYTVVLLQFAFL